METATQEETLPVPMVWNDEGVLPLAADPASLDTETHIATTAQLSENSRLGFASKNVAPHRGSGFVNSTSALGIEPAFIPEGVRSCSSGRENDGTGLYFYRARYYNPTFGRFISEDPIGFAGGQANLYAYVFNSPTNFVDPFGLDAWDWVQNFGDFSNGAASVLTFGLTDQINNALGNSQFVNKCSGWHTLGTVAGIGLTTAIGGAAGAEAAEANAGEEGYEFSHWIPNRMGGPRSVFNGNYVSEEFHYLTDPFRYPSGWQEFGPKLPAAAQQLLRIPWVYGGGAAGAAYGGASAMAGRNCGCSN